MTTFDERVQRLTVERQELLRRWLADDDAAANHADADPEPAPVAPATPTEELLAAIWAEVLELDAVGVDDDYFALGGDSVLAIVVVAKAQRAGLALTIQDLFDLRTVRALAEAVADASTERQQPAPPDIAEPGPAYGLTPMQEGMLYHTIDDPTGTAYVVQVSCRLDGDLDIAAFADACRALVDRYPVLRTSFRWNDGQPRQLVHPAVTLPIDVVDLRCRSATAQQESVDAYLAADRGHGFALDRPPLLRLALLRLTDTACVFVLTHHHLLLDGWSQQILLRDLLDSYDRPDGRTAATAWFDAHLGRMAGDRRDRAAQFWRAHLEGFAATPVTESLPAPTGRFDTADVALTERQSSAVAAAARRHGLTLGTVLYGAWALQVRRWTGRDTVAFGATVAGRPPDLPGIIDAVGMFINTLPLHTSVPPDEALVSWLANLQRQRIRLDTYHDSPLTFVARCRPDGVTGALFDTIAVVENFPHLVTEGQASRRLTVTNVAAHVAEGYPLVFEARPGRWLRLRLRHDTGHLSPDEADATLTSLAAFLDWFAGSDGRTVADAVDHLESAARRAHSDLANRRRAQERRALLSARRQPATDGASP